MYFYMQFKKKFCSISVRKQRVAVFNVRLVCFCSRADNFRIWRPPFLCGLVASGRLSPLPIPNLGSALVGHLAFGESLDGHDGSNNYRRFSYGSENV